MGFLSRLLTSGVRSEIARFTDSTSKTLCVFLVGRYAPDFEYETALDLAVAVTNELFGAPPGNEQARQFLASHKDLVDAKLSALKDEPQICHIVSVATHTKANLDGNTGSVTPEMLASWVKLTNFGILLPIENMPSKPEDLVQEFREFERWVINNSAKSGS